MIADSTSQSDGLFETKHLRQNLKHRSIRGGAATLFGQGCLVGVGIVRGGILARLLSPEDYGLQGMVLALVSIALFFKDLGLSTATIREERISQEQVSNLFWINTGLGLLSMCLVVMLGPVLVWFYGEPRLLEIAVVLSLAYLFGGLSVQHQALMQRQMQFDRLAAINISANVVSSLIGVYLASIGCSYRSLIWMQVANSLLLMVGFWLGSGWVPSWMSRGSGCRSMIRIGGHVAALNTFATVSNHFDAVLIGRFCGILNLGLYSRAFQLVSLINTQLRMAVSSVALPGLSALQKEPDRFSRYCLRCISVIAFATMPCAAFGVVFAEDIIRIYLGMEWLDAVPYFRILSIGAFTTPVIITVANVPLALGYSRRYLWTGILKGTSRLLAVAVGVAGWGAMGAAVGLVVIDLLIWLPYLMIAFRGSTLKISAYFRVLIAPAAISLVGALVVRAIGLLMASTSLSALMIYVGLYLIVYVSLYLVVDCFHLGCDLNFARGRLQQCLRLRRHIISAYVENR